MQPLRVALPSLLIIATALMSISISCSGCKKENTSGASTGGKTDIGNLKSAEGRAAHLVQGPDFDNVLVSGKEFKDVGGGDYIVSGNKSFDGWFLKADRIIFEPGATLTFSKTALS